MTTRTAAVRARKAVEYAVRSGKLKRQLCEKCGKSAQAHHDDYEKPLDVRWLCPVHHAVIHYPYVFDNRKLSSLVGQESTERPLDAP